MAHYMLRAKLSNEAFKGYVNDPQDREGPIKAIVSAVGMAMHKIYFSVSTAELIVIAEGNAEQLAAIEMVVASSGATIGYEAIEIIDSKSMTAAMETANKVVSAYQAPNK